MLDKLSCSDNLDVLVVILVERVNPYGVRVWVYQLEYSFIELRHSFAFKENLENGFLHSESMGEAFLCDSVPFSGARNVECDYVFHATSWIKNGFSSVLSSNARRKASTRWRIRLLHERGS